MSDNAFNENRETPPIDPNEESAESRRLAESIAKTTSFYEQLIQSNPDGIIGADMKGRIILFNPAAESILGYTAQEAKTQLTVADLYFPGEAEAIMIKLRSDDYGGPGKLNRQRLYVRSKTGLEMPISLSACMIYDGDKPVATVGIFRDISNLERMEKKLEEARAQLFKAEKMASLGKLAAGIAHEINNPLSGILIYGSLVAETLEPEDSRREDLQCVIAEALKCQEIVKDLLEFAHSTSFEISSFDLNQVIETAMRLMIKKAVFNNLRVTKELDPNLPQVVGNPSRIRQVIINLVMNAVDAMQGQGNLTIRTRLRGTGQMAEIEITDSGPGIPEDILPKIFDRFFTTKEVGKGTGLGLSVTYTIVKAHSGNIRVKSKVGEGASFFVDLPVSDIRQEEQSLG